MKNSIKILLVMGSFACSLSAFAESGHDEKRAVYQEALEMTGIMEMMQQMQGNMKDMMGKLSDPEMQKKMKEMQENMGAMMHNMDGMMCMGPMRPGMMNHMKMHGMMGHGMTGGGMMGGGFSMGPMHGEMMEEMTEEPAKEAK